MWPFTKNKPSFWDKIYEPLATYNSEVARGILHTPEWELKMQILQKEYDWKMRQYAVSLYEE